MSKKPASAPCAEPAHRHSPPSTGASPVSGAEPAPWQGTVPFAKALAGASGGAATVLVLHPLDTLKTRLQAAHEKRSAVAVARSLLRRGSARVIYSGAIPNLAGSMGCWAIYFQVFHSVRPLLAPMFPGEWSRDLAAGVVAGVSASAATNPIWVVKVRAQLQHAAGGSNASKGLGVLVGDIARHEGVRGFYRGIGPSMWLVSHGSIQFALYERFKAALRAPGDGSGQGGVPMHHSSLASVSSKLIASVATYPLQVVRTRMQEKGADRTCYQSMPRAAWHMLKYDGIRGFYRGLAANIARVVPQTAVTFVTYEEVLKIFTVKTSAA